MVVPTNHSGSGNGDLLGRLPGQLLWQALWRYVGQMATHIKQYLLRLAQWAHWAWAFSLVASPQHLSLGASLCQSWCPRGELDWLINWFQISSNCVKNRSNITQQHSVPTHLKVCFYLLTTKLIADSWHLWRLWGPVTFPYTNKEIKEGRFLEQNKQQHDKTSLVLTVSVCFVCVYVYACVTLTLFCGIFFANYLQFRLPW